MWTQEDEELWQEWCYMNSSEYWDVRRIGKFSCKVRSAFWEWK